MTPRPIRKMYIVVTVLGGAALMVDRCILTPSATMPASVKADAGRGSGTRGQGPAVPPTPDPRSPAESLATLELPFPRGIPAWNPQSSIRDLFAPFSDEDAPDKRSPRLARGADAGHGTCAAFESQRRLDAVLVQESLKIAILDGAWVRIGESLGGCVLTEIVGNKVRFRCRDGDTILALSPRN